MQTLEEILTASAAVLDLSASLPTGDELTTRINYANQAVWDALSVGYVPELKGEYLVYATGATVPLPTDFYAMIENPRIYSNGWLEYPEIEAEEKYDLDSGDRYSYVLGTPKSKNLILNGAVEGTLSLIYQKYPQGFATLTDVCELPDPMYVVRKIEAYVLYSRGDDRFQIAQAEAEKYLLNMMGTSYKSSGGKNKMVRSGLDLNKVL